MTAMSRRFLIAKTLPSAQVAIAGIATIAWTVTPDVAEAVPLGFSKGVPLKVEDAFLGNRSVRDASHSRFPA